MVARQQGVLRWQYRRGRRPVGCFVASGNQSRERCSSALQTAALSVLPSVDLSRCANMATLDWPPVQPSFGLEQGDAPPLSAWNPFGKCLFRGHAASSTTARVPNNLAPTVAFPDPTASLPIFRTSPTGVQTCAAVPTVRARVQRRWLSPCELRNLGDRHDGVPQSSFFGAQVVDVVAVDMWRSGHTFCYFDAVP